MGNQALTPEAMKDAESKLLAFSGLNENQIEVRQVIVDKEQNYITTFIVGDPTKQKLVLIHGYGGSGALLYRLFPGLINDFYVFAIDVIGMGSSSRPDFNCRDGQEADLYMLGYLEKWRFAMD